ncbi:MAG: DUF1027 domain-containing protein [Erysipelotrichales bacterium]|nr:DUF1027 domain-containing protein [Erysipelotrichales bacterium]
MILETTKGNFELLKNHREAFDIAKFQDRYIEEIFDKFTYLVGDVSNDILRIKGFSSDPKSKNSFKTIPDYLNESCVINAKFFILKRIRNK